MSTKQNTAYAELENAGRLNQSLYKVTSLLGLTTGVGVIVWGFWSLFATLATFVYEESGATAEEIMINSALNEGLLLSAVVIALGVIVLDLKKIQDLIQSERSPADGSDDA